MAAPACNDPRHAALEARLKETERRLEEVERREKAGAKESAKLRERLAELESRLRKNSRNSSRPPSSDSPYEARASRAKPSGRKRGGQPGRKGTTRALVPVEEVDGVVPHGVSACPGCGGRDLEQTGVVRHQVTELPPVRPQVVEHQVLQVRCRGCGAAAAGELPADVARSQFGPRVHAFVALLNGEFRLTHREVTRGIEALFGLEMAVGSVAAVERRVTAALEAPFREAQRVLREGPAAHIDETGSREGLRKATLWVAHYGQLALFHVDRWRNRAASRRLFAGVFRGVRVVDRTAVHDHVLAYLRQLCLAHLIRDFEGFATGPKGQRRFGASGAAIVRKLVAAWKRFQGKRIDRARLTELAETLRDRMVELLESAAAHAHARIRRFAKHLLKHVEALITFARVEGIGPTNNAAERLLRCFVLWRKGSFGTQSRSGSRFVSRFLTTTRSLRLQGRDLVAFLLEALDAHAHGRDPPSLLPPAASG